MEVLFEVTFRQELDLIVWVVDKKKKFIVWTKLGHVTLFHAVIALQWSKR